VLILTLGNIFRQSEAKWRDLRLLLCLNAAPR
jgi:hypothetical protein